MDNLPESIIIEHESSFDKYVQITKMITATSNSNNDNTNDNAKTATTNTTDTAGPIIDDDSNQNTSNGPPHGFICQVDTSKVLSDEHWYKFLRETMLK